MQRPRARCGADALQGREAARITGRRAHQQRTAGAALAQHLGDAGDRRRIGWCRRWRRQRRRMALRAAPGDIRGQDQRRDLPRAAARGGHGSGRVGRQRMGGLSHPQPVRHRPRECLDVGFERTVPALVRGGVIADHVDDRALRPPRVVQVGCGVGETRTQVQQRQRGLAGDARVAVGHATDCALEEPEHRPDLRQRAERRDEMHLGGAGVSEAHLDARIGHRAQQACGAGE